MVLAPAPRAQGPEGRLPHAQSAGAPGAPGTSTPDPKGGGRSWGPALEDVANVTPGGRDLPTGDSQDGYFCDKMQEPVVTTFPAGMPPAANYARIGPRPHDLGALIRGGASIPTPGHDGGASLQALALAGTPFAHPHGYGVSFALGAEGTVAPASGAFVHPFTLLSLPSFAPRMGLLLQMKYLSNAQHPAADSLPFGHGFVLTGHDFLVETSGSSTTEGAAMVSLFRGDGREAKYVRFTGTNPWTYTGPDGAQDALTAHYTLDPQAVTYVRTLRDGRRITYARVGTSTNFVRNKVVDGYGNTILYSWLSIGPTAYLQSITDTRGMTVLLDWDTGSPTRVEKIQIVTTGAVINPPQADATAVTQDDLTIDFAYDANRRLQQIQWFPTRVIDDANTDGRLSVAEAAPRRPTVELEYEANGKLAKIWDKTVPATSVLQLHVEYASSWDWGVRVVKVAEGDVIGTTGVPTHEFAYPSPTTRTYTDPRGRSVALTLDADYRTTIVQMQPGPVTPRVADNHTGAYADHADMTWTLSYGCCSLPSLIWERSGRAYTYTWAGNALQMVTIGYLGTTHTLHEFVLDPLGRVKEWKPGAESSAVLTVTYTPPDSPAPSQVEVATRSYINPRNTTIGPRKTTMAFDALGRLVTTTRDGDQATTDFAYVPGGFAGRFFLQSMTGPAAGADLKQTWECDDLGRPSSVTRGLTGGERETKLYVDSLGRMRRILAKVVASGWEVESEAWQDRFGAVALSRRANRDSDGTARARPWLQSENLRDPLGRVVRSVRDGAVVTASSEVPLVTQTTWHRDHRIDTVTGPNGGVTAYVWDGYGLLYKTLVQASATETLTPRRLFYDQDGLLAFAWNGLGHELAIERSLVSGLVSKVHDPAGLNRIELGYDPSLRLSRIGVWGQSGGAWSEARATALSYDALGRVAMVSTGPGVNPDSHRIHCYDVQGRLEEVGLQQWRGDSEYRRGFLRKFDKYDRLEWQRDRLSDTAGMTNQTSFSYHALTGLPTTLTEREIEQATGQFGELVGTAHSAHEYRTDLVHDLLDRVVRVEQLPETAGDSVVHQYHRDSLGELVRFVDALGAELRWTFDAQGNLRKRVERGTQGGEIENLTAIDFATGVVTRTDSVGKVSTFRHDLAWRLTKQEFPGHGSGTAHAHSFTYDAASRLTLIVNGNNVNIKRTYDESGRLREQWAEPPLNGHSEWATKEVFAYDVFGGLMDLTTKAGATYATHVVTAQQRQDAYGRTDWESFDFLGGGTSLLFVNSDYGVTGNNEDLLVRHQLGVDGATTVSFQLDRLGRTWGYGTGTGASVDDYIARYRFVGGRVRERQQGKQADDVWLLSSDHGWDPLRRLTSLETKKITGGTVLSRFDHTFDLEGHLTKRKRDRVGVASGGGDMFQLDEYYRLAGTKLGVDPSQFGGTYAGATTYQREVEYSPASAPLDEAQNRHLVRETTGGTTTDLPYTLDPDSHRYTQANGLVLTYDGEGNLISDGWRFFVYDFKNRLSEVWQYFPVEGEQAAVSASASRDGRARYAVPRERLHRIRARARNTLLAPERMQRGYGDVTGRAALANQDQSLAATEGNLQLVAVYGYDPFNRRVIRHVVGQVGLYSTWDGWREVSEQVWLGSSWFAVKAYVWGSRIDELLRYSRNLGGGWEHFLPQQDHQDSVDLLVGADGVPKEKYEYDPFGGVTVFTWSGTAWVSPAAGSPLGNPYAYTGRRLDGETGLMYYRNRYYWPALGRFVTGDPIGVWGDSSASGSPYSYAGGGPLHGSDAYGLYTIVFVINDPHMSRRERTELNSAAKRAASGDVGGGAVVTIDVNREGKATISRQDFTASNGGKPTELYVGIIAHGPGEQSQADVVEGGDDTSKSIEEATEEALGRDDVVPTERSDSDGQKTKGPRRATAMICNSAQTRNINGDRRKSNPAARLADKYKMYVLGITGPMTVRSNGTYDTVANAGTDEELGGAIRWIAPSGTTQPDRAKRASGEIGDRMRGVK